MNLWQWICSWFSKKGTKQVTTLKYNPLGVLKDSFVKINDIDYAGLDFKVKEITQWRRTIGGESFYFTDYVLISHKVGETSPTIVRIRCEPIEDAMQGDVQYTALWMVLYKEFGFQQDFVDVLNNTSGGDPFDFTEDDSDTVIASYKRMTQPNGKPLVSAYLANLTTVKASDGALDDKNVDYRNVQYWDFYRNLEEKGADGNPKVEYCYAEVDQNDGWSQVWTATEIAASNFQIL